MAARVGFKLVIFQTHGTGPITEPPRPTALTCYKSIHWEPRLE